MAHIFLISSAIVTGILKYQSVRIKRTGPRLKNDKFGSQYILFIYLVSIVITSLYWYKTLCALSNYRHL